MNLGEELFVVLIEMKMDCFDGGVDVCLVCVGGEVEVVEEKVEGVVGVDDEDWLVFVVGFVCGVGEGLCVELCYEGGGVD